MEPVGIQAILFYTKAFRAIDDYLSIIGLPHQAPQKIHEKSSTRNFYNSKSTQLKRTMRVHFLIIFRLQILAKIKRKSVDLNFLGLFFLFIFVFFLNIF